MALQHNLSICYGTACYAKGARPLYEYAVSNSPVNFNINQVQCLGNCSGAPVIVFDGQTISNATTEVIGELFATYGNNDTSTLQKTCPNCEIHIPYHQTICEACGWEFDYGVDAPLSKKLASVDFCRALDGTAFKDSYAERYFETVGSGQGQTVNFETDNAISGGMLTPLSGLCSKLCQINVSWSGWKANDNYMKTLKVHVMGTLNLRCTTVPQPGWYSTIQSPAVRIVLTNNSAGFSSLNDSNVVGSAIVSIDKLINVFSPNQEEVHQYFEVDIDVPYPSNATDTGFSGGLWVWGEEMKIINLCDTSGNIILSGNTNASLVLSGYYGVEVSKSTTTHTYIPSEVVTYSDVEIDNKFTIADTDIYTPGRCVQERHLVYNMQRNKVNLKGWTGIEDANLQPPDDLYGVHNMTSYNINATLYYPAHAEFNPDTRVFAASVEHDFLKSGWSTIQSETGSVGEERHTLPYMNMDISIGIPIVYYDKRIASGGHLLNLMSVKSRVIKFPIYINGQLYHITTPKTSAFTSYATDSDTMIKGSTETASFRIPSIRATNTNGGAATYVVEMGKPEVIFELEWGNVWSYISGTVTDSFGNPINGAFVEVKGRTASSGLVLVTPQTDENGQYRIKVTADELNNGTLRFWAFEYELKDIEINGRTTINCHLAQEILKPISSIQVYPQSTTIYFKDTDSSTKSLNMTASLDDGSGYTTDITRVVEWSSSNTSVARITYGGVVTVYRPSTKTSVTITARYKNGVTDITDTATIAVQSSGGPIIGPVDPWVPDGPEIVV